MAKRKPKPKPKADKILPVKAVKKNPPLPVSDGIIKPTEKTPVEISEELTSEDYNDINKLREFLLKFHESNHNNKMKLVNNSPGKFEVAEKVGKILLKAINEIDEIKAE